MRRMVVLLLALHATACASVPKESVQLSATVGKDLVQVHQAHRELAILMFDQMRGNINRFIDDVYAPHQIKLVMDRQWELAQSNAPSDRAKSLLLAINGAFTPAAKAEERQVVLTGMERLVTRVHDDIEEERAKLLSVVNVQEEEVLGVIDRNYMKIHYANSIVTGHLASVRKVYDAQDEVLKSIGVVGLREKVGQSLAEASGKINDLVNKAEKGTKNLEEAKTFADKIRVVAEGVVPVAGTPTK